MRRRNALILPMVLAAALAGCVPMEQGDLPNGDHVVTTYVRLQGFSEARDDNLWFARRQCGGSVVLVEETNGVDDKGAWDRLVYGCAATAEEGTDADASTPASGQTPR
jgi:hypothetical protein